MGIDEVWKPIPGYEGYYEASSLGRLRSVGRQVVSSRVNSQSPIVRNIKGRVRKTRYSRLGYLLVNLSVNGNKKTVSVHPLVCAAFHGSKASPSLVACHNNGVRDDNRPENLRWDTHSGNLRDRHKHGTAPTGENQYGAKLTWAAVNEIRQSDESIQVLAERYGVYHGHVRKILRNEKWIV